jgi:lipoprotein-anchoring transpeptidase ErfK/SrfK
LFPSAVRSRRRVRRRRVIILTSIAVLVLLTLAALYPIANGWTDLPLLERYAALEALDDARGSLAIRWAPELLQSSEATLRTGFELEAHEEAQILFFRDFRNTAEHYRLAAQGARDAASAAIQRKTDALAHAEGVRDSTLTLLRAVERVATQMPFPDIERIRLQQARNHAAEMDAFIANGEYEEACGLAQLSATEAELACSRAIPHAARFVESEQVRQWQHWVDETITWSRTQGRPAVVVYKEKNVLKLYDDGRLIKTYAADMGRNSIYPKRRAGDAATPEGRYHITKKKSHGNSKYYMALLLDYPNSDDRRRFESAKHRCEIPGWVKLGDNIEIHGDGGRGADWTLGCVALSNDNIRELSSRVEIGTPVTIVGGDGRDGTFSTLARAAAAGMFSRKP